MFTITHINRIHTDLTCNCLLPPTVTNVHCSSYNDNYDDANSSNSNNHYFYAACYELGKTNTGSIQKNNNEETSLKEDQEEERFEWMKEIISKEENSSSPMYSGSVTKYTYSLHSNVKHHYHDNVNFTVKEMKDMTYMERDLPNHITFPGVFDLNYIPRSWTPFAIIDHSHSLVHNTTKTGQEEPILITSCTDGSVRMLNTLPHSCKPTEYTIPKANLANTHIYTKLSNTMITSTTPFLFESTSVHNSHIQTLHLLTTHHGGGVQVTNTHKLPFEVQNNSKENTVPQEEKKTLDLDCTFEENAYEEEEESSSMFHFPLHSHEYDSWCSCVLNPPSTSHSAHLQLMCTGGDDGLIYFHDLRLCDNNDINCISQNGNNENNKEYVSSVIAKVQFDAGVVSMAPVVELCSSTDSPLETNSATSSTMENWNTPYLLAGCYDESLSLLDVRQLTQMSYTTVAGCRKVNTITRKTDLGGGVWRCNRTLYPTFNNKQRVTQHEEERLSFYCNTNKYMNAVNTDNTLVLPLMQRGAVLLPYNVKLSEKDIFASEPIYFPFEQIQNNVLPELVHSISSSTTELLHATHQKADQECLVYDVAVLNANHDCTEFVVATCSFYERAIDIWQVQC